MDDPSREHPAPISAAELASELHISLVTHGHGDHFIGPTSKVLAEKSSCLFVLPQSCLERARELKIPADRINALEPDYILPQHHDTYPVTEQNWFWTHAYAYEVQRRLSKALQKRYYTLGMGERIDITP